MVDCPPRGSSITFHPLEHLHPLEFHRPSERALYVSGSPLDLRSCRTSLERVEVLSTKISCSNSWFYKHNFKILWMLYIARNIASRIMYLRFLIWGFILDYICIANLVYENPTPFFTIGIKALIFVVIVKSFLILKVLNTLIAEEEAASLSVVTISCICGFLRLEHVRVTSPSLLCF